MVVRKSHFVSICLLALALLIAITEYVTYSPPSIPDTVDDDLFSTNENSSEQTTDDESDVVENSKDESSDDIVITPHPQENKTSTKKQIYASPTVEEEKTSLPAAPFSNSDEHRSVLRKGSTIGSILSDLGFGKNEIHLVSKSLSKVFNLKNLKIGQEILIKGKRKTNGDLVLNGLEIIPDPRFKIVISRGKSGNFAATKIDSPLKKVIRSVSGSFSPKNPEVSIKQCGVKAQIANEAVKALNQVANVRSSKSPVDFELLYKNSYDMAGNNVGKSELVYASMLVNGKICKVYKFNCNGVNEYVDSNGLILKTVAKSRSCLLPPLRSLKVTSPYSMSRVHPISGVAKRHNGVDFGAKIGTPVMAAASGVVTKASYYSGYGLYVNIKHSGNLSTAYGHLSRVVVRSGQRVNQGQVIAYTGNSGYSTGAHLHHEVIYNGKYVNPLSVIKLKQEAEKLTGKELSQFLKFKKEVTLQVVGLTPSSSIHKKTVGKLRKYS